MTIVETASQRIVSRYVSNDVFEDEVTGYFVATPYDADIIPLIKGVPGASFERLGSLWRVPFTSKDALLKVLPEITEIAEGQTDRRYRVLTDYALWTWSAEKRDAKKARPDTTKPTVRRYLPQIDQEVLFYLPTESNVAEYGEFLAPGRHTIHRVTFSTEVKGGLMRMEVLNSEVGTVYAVRATGSEADTAWAECGGEGPTPEVPWTAIRFDHRAINPIRMSDAMAKANGLERSVGWTFITA